MSKERHSSSHSAERLSEVSLFVAGIAYGASTPIGRELGRWLEPMTVAATRFWFAFPFCLGAWLRRKHEVEVPKRELGIFSVIFPVAVLLFTFALFETRIAIALFAFYLSNLLSSLFVGVVRNREHVDTPTAFAFVCSIAASFTFLFAQSSEGNGSWLGMLLAAGSGIGQTAASQQQKRLGAHVDSETLALLQVTSGMIVSTVCLVVVRDWSIADLTGTGLLLAFAYGFLLFGINVLQVFGFKHAPIAIGTILLSTEIVVGPLLAYAIFGETLSTLEIVGGGLTGIAVIATTRRKAGREPEGVLAA